MLDMAPFTSFRVTTSRLAPAGPVARDELIRDRRPPGARRIVGEVLGSFSCQASITGSTTSHAASTASARVNRVASPTMQSSSRVS